MSLRTLLEVIVYVSDMQRAVQFYHATLGIRIRYPSRDDYSQEHWVELETGNCSLCLHGGGSSALGADCAKIVFGVSDIRATRQALLVNGVALGEIRSPAIGVYVCEGQDPDGNPFSLEERC